MVRILILGGKHMDEYETHIENGKEYKIPIVYAFTDGRTTSEFFCKYCNKEHRHGFGEGHRSAHCSNQNSPYNKTGYIIKYDTKRIYVSGNAEFRLTLFDFSNINSVKKLVINSKTTLTEFEEKAFELFVKAYEENDYVNQTFHAVKLFGLVEDEVYELEDLQGEQNGSPDFLIDIPYKKERFYIEFKSAKDSLRMCQLQSFIEKTIRGERIYLLHVQHKRW